MRASGVHTPWCGSFIGGLSAYLRSANAAGLAHGPNDGPIARVGIAPTHAIALEGEQESTASGALAEPFGQRGSPCDHRRGDGDELIAARLAAEEDDPVVGRAPLLRQGGE